MREPRQQAKLGFLCSFIEERVDYPPDGSNGTCVIHYRCRSIMYDMHVNLINGKREGEAIIYRESEPYITVTYFHGQLTGNVTRVDEMENVNLRGYLINGVESGLFSIYNSCNPTKAYFRNGKPYSILLPCYRKMGYYEERSVDTGEVLSVSEYDKELHDKNGMCFEYMNGKVVSQWYYENGMRVQPIKDYNSNALRVYSPSGLLSKVRKCEISSENVMLESRLWKNGLNLRELLGSILREDKGTSLLAYDIKKRCDFGVLQDTSFCYQVKWSPMEYHLVAADMQTRKIRVYEELKTSSFYDEGVIDLNSNGKRWEGGIMRNRPFGYGVLYNEEGQKVFEGYMVERKKAIFGKEYFGDIGRVQYMGFFCDDKRCGKGVSYDRNGNVEFDGFWRNDKPYSWEFDGNILDHRLETVELPNQSLRTAGTLVFPLWMHSLKRIVTGKLCGDDVRFVEIDGLEKLESISFGERSFTTNKEWYYNWARWKTDGLLRILNCPNLEIVEIGEFSFSDYNFLELKNLPSLKAIEMEKKCFRFGVALSLVGWI